MSNIRRPVEVAGTYSNTKDQVSALESLHRKLPDLDAPRQLPPKRDRPGRARQLDDEQVQRLITGYQAGSTVHPDLAGQVIPGTGFMGETGDTGQSDLSGDSHGTSIAAIIAGSGAGNNGTGMIGLAPKARILPVRVSFGANVELIALAKGIFYATDHHANVINISEGTPAPDPTIRAAINYALGHNVVVVIVTCCDPDEVPVGCTYEAGVE